MRNFKMLVVILFHSGLLFAQPSKWVLRTSNGLKIYNMSNAVPAVSGSLNPMSGGVQGGGPNAVFNDAGDLLFYVYEGGIFTLSNVFCGSLPYFQTNLPPSAGPQFTAFSNPLAIVPVPGTCNAYYVVYTLTYGPGYLGGAYKTVYCKVDLSSGMPVINPASLDTYLINGIDYGIRNPKSINGISNFAISKAINAPGERYLFGIELGKLKVNKFLITNAGISLVNTIYQASSDLTYPNADFGHGEFELSPDQNHLAVLVNSAYASSTKVLYQFNLQNYNLSSFERRVFSPGNGYGLEYSRNSDKLFISKCLGGAGNQLFYVATADFMIPPILEVASSNINFGYSNLELGKSGNIYAIGNNGSQTYVYTINPNAPSVPSISNTGVTVGGDINYISFPIPSNVDGDSYVGFIGNAPPVSDFYINTSVAGNLPPQFIEVYSCNDIRLNNASSIGYLPPFNANIHLSYTVQSCDINGNVISGAGYLNYASDWRANTTLVNLKSLPLTSGGYQTWLANPLNFGYYKVTVTVRNPCLATSSKTAYIKVNAPVSPVSMNLQMNQGGGGICYSQNINANCSQTGIFSVGFNLGSSTSTFASNNIASYSRRIEEVDCNTGNTIALLYEDLVPEIPSNPSGSLVALNLNQAIINGQAGYFANNASMVFGKCYKLSVTVANGCSSFTDWTYFKMAPNGYWSSKGTLSTQDDFSCQIYPNPANDIITVRYQSAKITPASISIYDVQGKLLIQDVNLMNNGLGVQEKTIDISGLSKGLYIYKYNNGKEIVTGQISKL